MAEEFYPMPLFAKLLVRDVARSAAWYSEALGFRSVYAMPGPDGVQMMNHIRRERYQDLMLLLAPPDSPPITQRGIVLNFAFTGDMAALAAAVRAAGGKVDGPAPTRWNTLEVTATDPDGFVLTFSQILDAGKKFSDVMPPSAT